MIIYGWKEAHLKSSNSTICTCPNCESKGSMLFSVFSKHVHVFWIPFFPYGKKRYAECSHCKISFEYKEMPENLQQEYKNLLGETRTPIWQFSGVGIIAVLILWGVYSSKMDSEQEQQYLSNPEIGDVYEYKTDEGNYSTFKISEVFTDSIAIIQNDYETDKIGGVSKIDKSKNYSDAYYAISKKELKEMYDEKTIFDINRK